MKRIFAGLIAALGLAGCVAVPVAEPYPYYAPAVQPSVSFNYSSGYYGPHRHWRGHRHWH